MPGYERFRPNKTDYHLCRWYYRGGWHQTYPALILRSIYNRKKPSLEDGTQSPIVTLSGIANVSRLLRPVGPGSLSQYPSGGSHSHGPYPS